MNPVAILFGAFVLVLTVELLRRRSLREKYAAIWLVVSLAVIVLAVVPAAMRTASRFLGFALPSNLLFLLSGLVLTAISVQLSLEVGRLEGQAQRLAEEVALLRSDMDRLTERTWEQFRVPTPVGEDDEGTAGQTTETGRQADTPVEPQGGTDRYVRIET